MIARSVRNIRAVFPRRLVPIAAVIAVGASAVAYASLTDGRIGPSWRETGNGRVLQPDSKFTPTVVGNFPTGGALTPDGRFYWAVSTGRGLNDIRIVDTGDGHVVQIVRLPGASGGITMDPNQPIAYVSGVADSAHSNERQPDLQGRSGDVVQVFKYDVGTGEAAFDRVISVPPPAGSPVPQGVADVPGFEGPPQNFPPTNTGTVAWPDRLAVSRDGKKLLVPLNLCDHAAVIDTANNKVTYIQVGHYPYGAAITADGTKGYVSNETDGTLSVIDMTTNAETTSITVGPKLSHPEAITIDDATHRAYVAMANTDQVAIVDTATDTFVGNVDLERPAGLGVSPVALALDAANHRLYVAEEGGDDLAVIDLAPATPAVIGHIPTAAFTTDVAVHGDSLTWLSGKGYGFGPNPDGPSPLSPTNNDNQIGLSSYLPSAIQGMVGVLATPTTDDLATETPIALSQVDPVGGAPRPSDTVVRPGGPIKHVFFVVRENRTYDQVLGDVAKGDGDPGLELFPKSVTPNMHALVDRFPLVDHVYADSEASIDGHFWTSAASVSDYVQKNWMQNYGGRNRPYDFGVYAVTWPGNGFLFDQAERDGISYFNYGEAIAGDVPFPDKDRDAGMTAELLKKFAHSDLGAGSPAGVATAPGGSCYPNDADIETDAITMQPTYDGTPPAGTTATAESRFECFKQRFTAQDASGTVPMFNYLVLPNDHTVGTTPGKRTPQAMIADNDYGLGEIVDTISHSSIWSSSAIFVIEDDSQDGADHVDAHRIPAAVISPYTAPGAVISDRYDFLSVIRTMELMMGMEPLGLYDGLATPMYDVFTTSPDNSDPYSAIVPDQSRSELNTTASADAALSARLDFSKLDQVPQAELDRILWHAVHGEKSTPPPPGPHAEDESER